MYMQQSYSGSCDKAEYKWVLLSVLELQELHFFSHVG